jgi:uncharacterized membrane-anchored protein
MSHKMLFRLAVLAPVLSFAQDDGAVKIERFAKSLHYQNGRITLGSGIAALDVPEGFRFLDSADARRVLTEAWGNPPAVATTTLGMLFPPGADPLTRNGWGINITFNADGYVKDDDAAKLDYDKLLQQLKEGAAQASKQRRQQGFPGFDIVGWAAPPHYDAAAHKLYWAKELHFDKTEEDTLNYEIRVLGRRGVLAFNAIAGKSQLASVETAMPQVLTFVEFNQGHRYADFKPSVDKVAAYGVGALIVGVAAKAGLLKWLVTLLAAGWKFLVLGLAGLGALLKKIFARKKAVQLQVNAVGTPQLPANTPIE